jgi:carboxylesterase type B
LISDTPFTGQPSTYHPHPGAVVALQYLKHFEQPDNQQYAFHNIRYADPPIGEKRYRAPTPVSTIDKNINNGSIGYECRQGIPREVIVGDWIQEGETAEEANERLINYEGWSEDCLFLNVIAPKAVFDKRRPKTSVIVWIHGGGYMSGKWQPCQRVRSNAY